MVLAVLDRIKALGFQVRGRNATAWRSRKAQCCWRKGGLYDSSIANGGGCRITTVSMSASVPVNKGN